MKALLILLLVPFLITPAFAQTNEQIVPTSEGTLNVGFSTTEGAETKLNIDFINPSSDKIQIHIDYYVTVTQDGNAVFGPIPRQHTSEGAVSIPVELPDGLYNILVEVDGILFNPIPLETASIDFRIGPPIEPTPPDMPPDQKDEMNGEKDNEGGGCLIATATYGTELAPQVQQLREVRDNVILQTESGVSFMNAFNSVYYTFSPTVADWEREDPVFRQLVEVGITPMLMTLDVFNHVDVDSEADMLALGISIITLNLGIYVGLPVVAGLKLSKIRRN